MSQQKQKLSLTDFLNDKTLAGDSWADDDDFDPSSISLPTHSHFSHDRSSYQGNSYNAFGNNSRFNNNQAPNSPPYIIKINNIPDFFVLPDIEDLFQSRFMKFIKLKLFWDIDFNILDSSPNPLDAINQMKKVAFVELSSYQDSEKVLKWTNLNLDRGMGRLIINVGNFNDFKIYNDVNQQLPENLDPSLPAQHQHNNNRFGQGPTSPRRQRNSFNQPHPFNNQPFQPNHNLNRNSLNNNNFPPFEDINPTHQIKPHEPHELPPLIQPKPANLSKSNPFAKAKPVDTLTKELELEKKLKDLQINKTTFKTLGSLEQDQLKQQTTKQESVKKDSKVSNESIKPPQPTSSSKTTKITSPTQANAKLSFKKQDPKPPAKSISFIPALKPEVGAWGSAALLDSSSAQNSNNNSPTQSFAKITSPSLKHDDLNNSTKEDKTKKVILKRKAVDHKKAKVVLKKDDSAKAENLEEKKEEIPEETASNNHEKLSNGKDSKKLEPQPSSLGKKPSKFNKKEPKSQTKTESAPIQEQEKEQVLENTVTEAQTKDLEGGSTEFVRGRGRGRGNGSVGGRGRGRGSTRGSARGGRARPSLNDRVWVRNTDEDTNSNKTKESEPKKEKPELKKSSNDTTKPSSSTQTEKKKPIPSEAETKTKPEQSQPDNKENTQSSHSRSDSSSRGRFKRGNGRGRGRGRGGFPPRINPADRVYNRKEAEENKANTSENA